MLSPFLYIAKCRWFLTEWFKSIVQCVANIESHKGQEQEGDDQSFESALQFIKIMGAPLLASASKNMLHS